MLEYIFENQLCFVFKGFTPEQLRKKEKFLRNRQLKMEEDKLRREALLEKKRRYEKRSTQSPMLHHI